MQGRHMSRRALAAAANRSLLIAFFIVAPIMCLSAYETFFLGPGEGYLNSDETVPQTQAEKLSDLVHMVMIMPIEIAAIALFFFVAQLPLIVLGSEP